MPWILPYGCRGLFDSEECRIDLKRICTNQRIFCHGAVDYAVMEIPAFQGFLLRVKVEKWKLDMLEDVD